MSRTFREDALALANDLFAFACYLSGSRQEAEELVQDAYVKALAAPGRFTPGTSLKAWMLTLLKNAFHDRHRGAGNRVELRAVPAPDSPDETTFPFGGADHDVPNALAAVDVERALAALPAAHREIILLDLQGVTERDAAEVLGVAVGTIKSRLARARAALRVLLAAYGEQTDAR